MEPETVLKLLDSYWYDLNILNRKSKSNPKPDAERLRYNSLPDPVTLPTIHTKSSSSSSSSSPISQQRSDSASPNSVLLHPKLETIFSGKDSVGEEPEFQYKPRKKKGSSKSLSDLEYQELKGFMDLGFVFSEEDKDSILGSIIPGLQRLGQKSECNIEIGNFARPYLSESWGKNIRVENSLVNLKVPASVSKSEIDMKHYLKFWAHSVASAFR